MNRQPTKWEKIDSEAFENMFNFIHNNRDTDWNYNEIYFSPIRLGRIENLNNTIIAETVRKQALSYIIAGKAKWYKHCEENLVISNKIAYAIDPENIPPTV